jgi:hypothetical protein
MKTLTAIYIIFVFFMTVSAQDSIGDPAAQSELAQIGLPNGALRLREQNLPAEYQKLFAKYIKANPPFRQGKSEFLVFSDGEKTNVNRLRNEIENSLRNAGWDYKFNPPENGVALFMMIKKLPAAKTVFGYWVINDTGLILAMTELLDGRKITANQTETSDDSTISNQRQSSNSSNTQTYNLSASDDFVNVMGNKMPPLPSFPALPKKAGFLRGYVKDSSGKPLAGAYIGVRSTLNGGSYSGASGLSDAKGYYEIQLPFGAIHLYAAAFTVDYGELRASLSLHPADAKLDGFASADGDVENFVLLPYGITDRDQASEKPNGSNNYYGGSVRINYNLAEINNSYAPENYIRENSEIEITLTPEGNLLDGSAGTKFVIRKNVGSGMFFNIHNIPIGKYTITASLVKGNKPLFMRQSGRNKNNSGITPKETTGSAPLIFEPNSAQNVVTKPAYGSWNAIDINLFLSK